jgi:formate/nitrite transporter FocA (FNT family)
MHDSRTDAASERREAADRSAPSARVVHAAVVEQGADELARPVSSLFWSGFAAGIAIMASLWASGALHHYLPRAPWADAVVALGYPLGFLVVILGRLQLFTEHTAVAVLPVVRRPSVAAIRRLLRLWLVIFGANMLGAAAVSAAAALGSVQSPEMLAGMLDVSAKLLDRSFGATLMQAIPAGFLIASIAWIRSATQGSGFWVVFAITYGIALGGFAHVIAGASEAFLLVWHGDASLAWAAGGFIAPALIGNIVGGTGLFAMLAHAQVKDEG